MSKIEGHCLCGAVSYAAEAQPMATLICHCRNCQRQSGSAFSVNVVVPTDSIVTQGTVKTFTDAADSGNTVARQFCPTCGSPLFSRLSANPAITVIKAGTLDDTSAVQPGAQLWCDSRQAWVRLEGDMPEMAKNPA